MLLRDVEPGLAVRLVEEPETHGTILKRDGQRVRVDLSASGGPQSKWVHCKDIEAAEQDAEEQSEQADDDLEAMAAELEDADVSGEKEGGGDDLEAMAAELEDADASGEKEGGGDDLEAMAAELEDADASGEKKGGGDDLEAMAAELEDADVSGEKEGGGDDLEAMAAELEDADASGEKEGGGDDLEAMAAELEDADASGEKEGGGDDLEAMAAELEDADASGEKEGGGDDLEAMAAELEDGNSPNSDAPPAEEPAAQESVTAQDSKGMTSAGNRNDTASEPEPGPAVQAKSESSLNDEKGDNDVPAGPLTSKTVKKGMQVQLIADPSMKGTVLKKAGKNVQADFSESGGESSKWIAAGDLKASSSDAEPEPAAKEGEKEQNNADATAANEEREDNGVPAGPLTSKTVKKGMQVQLIADPSMKGTVLKKAGKNVQADFSESGGESSKWVAAGDLQPATEVTETESGEPQTECPSENDGVAAAAAATAVEQDTASTTNEQPAADPLEPVVVEMWCKKCKAVVTNTTINSGGVTRIESSCPHPLFVKSKTIPQSSTTAQAPEPASETATEEEEAGVTEERMWCKKCNAVVTNTTTIRGGVTNHTSSCSHPNFLKSKDIPTSALGDTPKDEEKLPDSVDEADDTDEAETASNVSLSTSARAEEADLEPGRLEGNGREDDSGHESAQQHEQNAAEISRAQRLAEERSQQESAPFATVASCDDAELGIEPSTAETSSDAESDVELQPEPEPGEPRSKTEQELKLEQNIESQAESVNPEAELESILARPDELQSEVPAGDVDLHPVTDASAHAQLTQSKLHREPTAHTNAAPAKLVAEHDCNLEPDLAELSLRHYLESMGLRTSAATERASTLLEQGYDTIDMVADLTPAELREYGGFKPGDLKKVAAYRQANASGGVKLDEGGTLKGWDTDPEPESVLLSMAPVEEAVPPESIDINVQAKSSPQLPADTAEPAAQATPATISFPRHRPAVPNYNENGDMTQARLLEIRRQMIDIYNATPELQHLPCPEIEIDFKHAASARRKASKNAQKIKPTSSGYGQRTPSRPKNRHAPASPTSGKAKRKTQGKGVKPQSGARSSNSPAFSPASARSGTNRRQAQRRDVL